MGMFAELQKLNNDEKLKKPPVNSASQAKELFRPTEVRTPARTYRRTPKRRTITRYAFEFYQDQIDTLRKISLEEKMNGEKGSMSEMVRDAIDNYIKEKLTP